MDTSEPDDEAPEVPVAEHGSVLVITINRPRQRNAMTRSAGQLIAAAIERLDSDPGLSVGVLTFDAARAEELGLVNRVVKVVDAGSALDGALELARRVAANAPLAVMASKQVVRESGDWPGSESCARQAPIVDPVFACEDAREGAVAFAEKRQPRWTGR
jgi:enoyl-CoA hydratase/carnithine racemase